MTITPTRSTGQVRTQVEPAIRTLLDRLDRRNRLVAGYQLGLWDAEGRPAVAGGKWLRPALALLGARAAGADTGAAVPAAAAVELVHTFSLLHDDLMDADTQRRHRPTAWAVFGPGPAVLAGDALLCLAFEALAATPGCTATVRRLASAVARLTAGQAADLEFEGRDDVGLEECLGMAADKTAALISCSCALGAELCGAPADLVAGLAGFGEQVGLAFQLVDDLLGIWGRPERTGKPVGADLRAGKKTVPVVRAATSGTLAGQLFAQLYRADKQLGDDEVAHAARLIEKAGARDWTAAQADELVHRAVAGLHELALPDDAARELADLAVFITARDH